MRRRDRRKSARRPAGWIARYSSGHGVDGWSRCEVVNVSDGGAGLVLGGPPPDEGTRLTLEVPPKDGAPAGGQLEGIVRHAALSPDGTMHIGIEFSTDESAVVVVKLTETLGTAPADV